MSPKKPKTPIAKQQTYLATVWHQQACCLNISVSIVNGSGQAVEKHCLSNANNTQPPTYMFQGRGWGLESVGERMCFSFIVLI